SQFSHDTIKACHELQQDELLALQAIYDTSFSHYRDDDGRLVFKVRVDVDLDEDREVIVVEEMVLQPEPQERAKEDYGQRGGNRSGKRSRGHRRGGIWGRSRPNNVAFANGNDSIHKKEKAFSVEPLPAGLDVDTVEATPTIPKRSRETSVHLRYLMPVELVTLLGSGYPLEEPPVLEIQCPWMPLEIKKAVGERILPRKSRILLRGIKLTSMLPLQSLAK
ncbi:MAG: hypothetical protein CYPHOPRED_002886, partial [Cyphobasidiales sp. Tagirdzhanova-0007]